MSENISSNLMRHFTCLNSKMAEFGVDWFQIDFFTKQLRQAFFSSGKYCEGCHLIYCITQNYFTYLGKSSICNTMLRCVKTHYSRIHTSFLDMFLASFLLQIKFSSEFCQSIYNFEMTPQYQNESRSTWYK